MSRRRYFEEQRSGNGAIYHCVETEIEPGDRIRLFNGNYIQFYTNHVVKHKVK